MFNDYATRHAIPNGAEGVRIAKLDPCLTLGGEISPSLSTAHSRVDTKLIREGIRLYETPLEMSQMENALEGITMQMTTRIGTDIDNVVADRIFEMMMERWGERQVALVKQECIACGGTLEMNVDQHIFKCPYCGKVYAVGVQMINAR